MDALSGREAERRRAVQRVGPEVRAASVAERSAPATKQYSQRRQRLRRGRGLSISSGCQCTPLVLEISYLNRTPAQDSYLDSYLSSPDSYPDSIGYLEAIWMLSGEPRIAILNSYLEIAILTAIWHLVDATR